MHLHQSIRLVCLTGAVVAPVLAAVLCRRAARIAVEFIYPNMRDDDFPKATEFLIVGVANGSTPLVAAAVVFAVVVMRAGSYIIFSGRVSADQQTSLFSMTSCVSFAATFELVAASLLALVIAAIPTL